MTTTLRFRRIAAGTHQADTDQRRYLITRAGRGWILRIWMLQETAGVKHTIGLGADDAIDDTYAETLALIKDIAARYDHLVTATDYGKKFTDLCPMTRATIDAYEAAEPHEQDA